MRLRADRSVARLLLLVVLLGAGAAAQPPATEPAGEPDVTAIARALDQVRADPNLATERTIRTLRWTSTPSKQPLPGWLRWIVGFVAWVAQSARLVVWVAGAVLAGLLAVYIVRMVRAREGSHDGIGFIAPTHVRDLDIRPESLPDDIGAAARALWDRGERRAALALLYRGLLSRLAHVHQVPIRDSTTEGSCLALAAQHLTGERHEYVSRLVTLWQRFVYGGLEADTAAVHALCLGFARALDRTPAESTTVRP
ncbi:MAG TPA: DUF4129 domain-containing protein [Vicinamibacterales bacterium]|nr:DUF4129 domain-containing protein [Vicinamibacterales bacterium]